MEYRAPLDHAPQLLTKSGWMWFDDDANPLDIVSNRRPRRTCDRRTLCLLAVHAGNGWIGSLPQPSVCEGAPMSIHPPPRPSALLVRTRRSLRPLAPHPVAVAICGRPSC